MRSFAGVLSQPKTTKFAKKNEFVDFTHAESHRNIVESLYLNQGITIEQKIKGSTIKGNIKELENLQTSQISTHYKIREYLIVNLCLSNKKDIEYLENFIIDKQSNIKFSDLIEYCWLFCIQGIPPKLFDLMKSRMIKELNKDFS